jgi:hypothetical protein
LQFRRGELGWGRRRRNRRGECRQSGHILTFTDGITDRILLSEIPSAILTVNQSRHCTEIPIWIPWLFCWQFWRWIGHITIRSSRFESLGDFVGKITRKKFHVSEPPFFYSEYYVCNYIGIYRPQYFIGIYRLNYGRNSVRR